MTRRRLGYASQVWSELEENGGLTMMRVSSSRGSDRSKNVIDEDASPELVISKPQHDSLLGNKTELTPIQLDAIASNDTVSDVLCRISSYIAISDEASPNFAYPDLSDKYRLDKPVKRDMLNAALKEHWDILMNLCFKDCASQMIGVQELVQSWLTYGPMWSCIIRDHKFGIPQKIVFVNEEPKKTQQGKDVTWRVGDYTVWEKEDIFAIDYKQLNRYYRSYVASIQRAFNIYSAVERTRIANAIMAAQFRSIYTVPTTGLGSKKARERLSTVMGLYKRQIRIDDATGQITINGENSYPVNTEIWVSETSSGSVKIENPGDGNPQLNDTDFVEYLMRKFYKQSKLPMSKYEQVDTGYLNGINDNDEDDRQFNLTISHHRAVFGNWFIQMLYRLLCGIPEYAADIELRKAILLHFYTEPKHETPTEELSGLEDKLNNISSLLDKIKTMLEESGWSEVQIKARLNWTRQRLMHKYVPELCVDTMLDYRNVQRTEQSMTDDEYSSATGDDAWMDGSSDDWGSSGSDDFSDFSNDDWEDEFDTSDSMGDDWSLPDNFNESDF